MNHRLLLAAATTLAASLAAPIAQADIVTAPPGVVNHGSYITDTVNHLDWYRFDNVANTRDISFDAALAAFTPLGWSAASLNQVQLLQAQFGWVADTPFLGLNGNYGMASAMADYLGYTSVDYTFNGALAGTTDYQISAMTSETFYFDSNPNTPMQMVTFDLFHLDTDAHGQNFFTGDFVEADHALQGRGMSTLGVGTWLTRASIDDTGCGRVAPGNCGVGGIPPVPEPETWLLTGAGLIGLLMRRNRVRD